jgi:hypothetical protein
MRPPCDPAGQSQRSHQPRSLRATLGSAMCMGSSAALCRPDGLGWDITPCGENGCNASRRACNICRPNTRSCADDRTPQTCRADGSGYQREAACPAPPMNGGGKYCDQGEFVITCARDFHPCRSTEGPEAAARLLWRCFSNTDSTFTCGPRTCNPCPGWANKCNMNLCKEIFPPEQEPDPSNQPRLCNPAGEGEGTGSEGEPTQHVDCAASRIEGRNRTCVALGCPERTVDCFNDPARMDLADPFKLFFFCCLEDGLCSLQFPTPPP